MSAKRWQYINTCPVYQGKEDTISTPLTVYKNVFCYRGINGRGNCKKYLEYQLSQ